MHPELLKLTVQACRDYMEAGDCHGEAPPSERLITAVVELSEQQGREPPFERGSWQHAVDDQLIGFGRTSQEFATPHEAVRWLLEQTSEAASTLGVLGVGANTVPHHTPMPRKDEQ